MDSDPIVPPVLYLLLFHSWLGAHKNHGAVHLVSLSIPNTLDRIWHEYLAELRTFRFWPTLLWFPQWANHLRSSWWHVVSAISCKFFCSSRFNASTRPLSLIRYWSVHYLKSNPPFCRRRILLLISYSSWSLLYKYQLRLCWLGLQRFFRLRSCAHFPGVLHLVLLNLSFSIF